MSKLEISPELLDALHKLSALLESDDPLAGTLQTVVDLSVMAIPGCDSAGVTVRREGKLATAAASDEYVHEIDRIQFDSNEGPCVSALEEGAVRKIEVVSEETRWPEFCRRAGERGLGSALSLPLKNDGILGALNLYSMSERGFADEAVEGGEVFAKQTAIALRNAQTYAAARSLSDQLNEALKTRDMIGQAKGILMEREGINDEEAFAMLRTISQSTNVKLRDVAQRLIEEKARASG